MIVYFHVCVSAECRSTSGVFFFPRTVTLEILTKYLGDILSTVFTRERSVDTFMYNFCV